jgi:hypothetical protein
MRAPSLGRRSAGVALAAVAYSGSLVFLRGRPTINSDSGIFLSVAARLLDGDRLYAGVWDNKPPFFYYGQAAALGVLGWRGPALLDVIWTSVAVVSMWLLLREAGVSPWARRAGTVLYPLLLTGTWYYAGYSELPPLALAPAIGWLVLSGRLRRAGALSTVAIFFRLDYALIVLSLLVAGLHIRAGRVGDVRRSAPRLLTGVTIAAAASVVLLAARGELTGYVDDIRSQLGYPNRVLKGFRVPPNVFGHVRVARGFLIENRGELARVLFVLAVAVIVLLAIEAMRRPRLEQTTVTIKLLVPTALAVAATLALEATFDHSIEPIALPGTLGACLVVTRLEAVRRRWRVVPIAAAALGCCIAFGGVSLTGPSSPQTSDPLQVWWRMPHSISAIALDRAAREARGRAGSVTYARLGYNDDEAHAAFTHEPLDLRCPVFHQYPFSVNLGEVLSCIRERRPKLIMVGPFFRRMHGSQMGPWNAFVTAARRLLHARYEPAVRLPDNNGIVAVYRARS